MNTFKLSNIVFNIVIFHFIYVSGQCDIYTSKCNNEDYISVGNESTFFIQHNFTLDTAWDSVGDLTYCGNGTCHAIYTMKIEKSTQITYGNERSSTQSSTVGNSSSISATLTSAVSAGFSKIGLQYGGSIEAFVQLGSEGSVEVSYENGFTVCYSTSTANTVGVEKTIICDGIQNEKISIQSRTNMTRLTGNVCSVYLFGFGDETPPVNFYKCNYVDLKMYPVHDKNVFTELKCNREIKNS